MIYALSRAIDAILREKGCPFPVVYGPEKHESTAVIRNRIVVERPRERGADAGVGPRSQQRNPAIINARAIAVRVLIYAQATVAGARVQDHERLADAVADAFESALYAATKQSKTLHAPPVWGLLSAEDLALIDTRTWHGVVYEGRFTVDRGVLAAVTWKDPAAPAVAVADLTFQSTTLATVNGSGAPEAACGNLET